MRRHVEHPGLAVFVGGHEGADADGLVRAHGHRGHVEHGAPQVFDAQRLAAGQVRLLEGARVLAILGLGLIVRGCLDRRAVGLLELVELALEPSQELFAQGALGGG